MTREKLMPACSNTAPALSTRLAAASGRCQVSRRKVAPPSAVSGAAVNAIVQVAEVAMTTASMACPKSWR
jgi:hypothetical protein